MRQDPWYEDENPDRVVRGFGLRLGGWIIVAIIFFALIGIGTWAFRVATSDVKGRGDSAQIKNSAPNRIRAQQEFNRRYQDIKATDAKITVFAESVKADPKDVVSKANLDGTTAYCLSAVGEYNSLAREYASETFRDIDLPSEIDTLDPATDCKGDLK
jgi:hypothetical protein